MNEESNRLYAAGDNGTHAIDVNGPNLKTTTVSRADKPSTTVEVVRDGQVITQEPNTNQLELNDPNLTELKQIDGLFEDGKPVEDLHHYRHSLDHKYMLWRSGQDNLTVVDAEKFEAVEVIKQFWTYEKRSTMPVAAASNRRASKIVGTSQAGPDNYVVHYYEDQDGVNIAYAKPVSEVIPSMHKLTCMDVSFDEQRVYIAGLLGNGGVAGNAVVIACEFNETLKEISGKRLDDVNYGTPHRLKRVKGSTEQMIVACDKHFAVMEFTGGQMIQIGSILNVHDNEICDFVLRDKFLYSKALNEPHIKVTEMNTGAAAPVSGGIYNNLQTSKTRNDALVGLEKVVVNPQEDTLYTGGKGLHVFKNAGGGKMNPVDLDQNRGKFLIINNNLRH